MIKTYKIVKVNNKNYNNTRTINIKVTLYTNETIVEDPIPRSH